MPRVRNHNPELGVALIAVLSLLAVLVVLAGGVIEITRRHAQVLQRSMETSQVYEHADSAIRLTLLNLSKHHGEGGHRDEMQPVTSIYSTRVAVTIGYEAGRVDLNYADRDLLFAMLAAHGIPEQQAEATADGIIDWRDPDDQRQPHGAERSDYRANGQPGPRNGLFESIDELRLVLGAESIDRELVDAFTVYSHAPSARAMDAAPAVSAALRWADARELGGHRWLEDDSTARGQNVTRSIAGETVRIEACVDSTSRGVCRRAIVRLTGSEQKPWQILCWQSIYAEE